MVENLCLRVVVENSTSVRNMELLGKHGLCLLLEVTSRKHGKTTILMDSGPSPDVTLHNIATIGLDMKNVDVVFLSHGHYDHTGGLIETIKKMDKKVPVLAHPKIFNPKFTSKLRFIGPPFKPIDVESVGGTFLLAQNSVTLVEDVMTSGEVERLTGFEAVKGFLTVEDGVLKEDALPDDQALIVDIKDKGLAVITGCAHSGVVNTVKYAQKITGVNRVYAVLGGFHLETATDEKIKLTIDELVKLDPKIVSPCHCTGIKAISKIANVFGVNCIPLQTGDYFEL